MAGGGGFNRLWFHFFTVLIFATIVRCAPERCTYKFKVKTGSWLNSGTDSVIGLTLYNSTGWGVPIKDLAKWGGTKGPNYDYFEWRSLDEFNGTAPCLTGKVCKIKLTSDGSGSSPGWFCEYVEVKTATENTRFDVGQWLDESNGLNVVQDNCGKYASEVFWSNILGDSVVSAM